MFDSLCNLKFSYNCELVTYADDLLLYKSVTSGNDWNDFQSDISKISMWAEENQGVSVYYILVRGWVEESTLFRKPRALSSVLAALGTLHPGPRLSK